MTVFEPLKTDVPNATVESWKVFVEAARGWATALRGESREPIVTRLTLQCTGCSNTTLTSQMNKLFEER